MSDKLTKLNAELKAIREKLQQESVGAILEVLKLDLFDKYPNLESVGWAQYTPYFNDGDRCSFSVYAYEPEINGYEYYEDVEESEEEDFIPEKDFYEAQSAASDIINSIDEEILSVLGEGKVVINRDGSYEVEDYNHD